MSMNFVVHSEPGQVTALHPSTRASHVWTESPKSHRRSFAFTRAGGTRHKLSPLFYLPPLPFLPHPGCPSESLADAGKKGRWAPSCFLDRQRRLPVTQRKVSSWGCKGPTCSDETKRHMTLCWRLCVPRAGEAAPAARHLCLCPRSTRLHRKTQIQ